MPVRALSAIGGYSLDLMRRDPGDHPNGLLDFALCSTIEHLKEMGMKGLSLNFVAMRSVLEGDTGDGVTHASSAGLCVACPACSR